MMAKKTFFSLVFSLVFLSSACLLLFGEENKAILAEGETTYSRSVTLYPADLPTSLWHSSASIIKNGLSVIIGESISNQAGWICFNSDASSGIQFPAISSKAGPHGVGYTQLIFGPAASGDYCLNVARRGYAIGNTTSPYDHEATLSTSEATTIAVSSDHPDYVFAYSKFSGGLSTRVAYLTISYNCQSA